MSTAGEGRGEDGMKGHHPGRAGGDVLQGWLGELGLPGLVNQQQPAAPRRGAAKMGELTSFWARAEAVAGAQSAGWEAQAGF